MARRDRAPNRGRKRVRLLADLPRDEADRARYLRSLQRFSWKRGVRLVVDARAASPRLPAAVAEQIRASRERQERARLRRLAREVCGPFDPARALGSAR